LPRTGLTNAIHRPSGDQAGARAFVISGRVFRLTMS
jgi:hypothetical protein